MDLIGENVEQITGNNLSARRLMIFSKSRFQTSRCSDNYFATFFKLLNLVRSGLPESFQNCNANIWNACGVLCTFCLNLACELVCRHNDENVWSRRGPLCCRTAWYFLIRDLSNNSRDASNHDSQQFASIGGIRVKCRNSFPNTAEQISLWRCTKFDSIRA